MICKIKQDNKKIINIGIVFIIAIINFVIGSVSFAENKGDCDIIHTTNYRFIDDNWNTRFGNILPYNAVSLVADHLRSYCCKEGIIQNKSLCQNTSEFYLESPFLYDHLFDIMMRRLDAYGNLTYNLSPDKQGVERRKYINTVANDIDGEFPILIGNNYKKYRQLFPQYGNYLTRWNGQIKYSQASLFKELDINKEYASRQIGTKYINMCEILTLVYEALSDRVKISFQGKVYNIFIDGYKVCKQRVLERIGQENEYVRAVIANATRIMTEKYLESFILDKLSIQKLRYLSKILQDIDGDFLSVERAVPKIIPVCS